MIVSCFWPIEFNREHISQTSFFFIRKIEKRFDNPLRVECDPFRLMDDSAACVTARKTVNPLCSDFWTRASTLALTSHSPRPSNTASPILFKDQRIKSETGQCIMQLAEAEAESRE